MKKVIKNGLCLILIVSLILITALCAGAAETDVTDSGKTVLEYGDWMLENINQGTQWELDEYTGSDEAIYVPRFYNSMLIVALGDHSFMNNTTVKSVFTSSPLWTIGEYAFIDCTSLESIELNFALETIGIGAFSGTSSLKNINLEDSIVTEIKPYTFLNSGIESVVLPETCTKIDNYAFGQCYNLSRIEIPNSVTEIHEDAFKLSDNVVIYAASDSYAIEYAIEHDIDYVLTDVETITYILGDADGDEIVNIIDATRVQRILAELYKDTDGMCSMRGDIDGDGLDIMDATRIQRHIAAYDDGYHIGEKVTKTLE